MHLLELLPAEPQSWGRHLGGGGGRWQGKCLLGSLQAVGAAGAGWGFPHTLGSVQAALCLCK